LTVTGTGRDDTILISVGASNPTPTPDQKIYRVSINGHGGSFKFTDVRKIIIRAGAGDDVVDLNYYTYAVDAMFTGSIDIPVVVRGGAGNDHLYAGGRRTILRGNAGDDLLEADHGRAGVVESGGAGRDTLIGSYGDDVLHGGSDSDSINGLDGIDEIRGDGGDDSLFGDAGDDHLAGGDGNDYIFGSQGNDVLMGGAGNDNVIGSEGFDRIWGNEGRDLFMPSDSIRERRDQDSSDLVATAIDPPDVNINDVVRP
jgi:Ca2+-binding RTX toxin-like protein